MLLRFVNNVAGLQLSSSSSMEVKAMPGCVAVFKIVTAQYCRTHHIVFRFGSTSPCTTVVEQQAALILSLHSPCSADPHEQLAPELKFERLTEGLSSWINDDNDSENDKQY